MGTKKQPPPPPPSKPKPPPPAPAPRKEHRWGPASVSSGHYIKLPRSILKRFGDLKIEPQHLLLLLVLQGERFENRPPRFYWEELGEICGVRRNTVRRWGYELKRKGLLGILPIRKRQPGEKRHVGYRNARSVFDLASFQARVDELHLTYLQDKKRRRRQEAAA